MARVSVAVRRERQRESAVIAETIEQPPVRVAARRFAVLALIEEQPGLLPREQIDVVAHASFAHVDMRRAPRPTRLPLSSPALRARARARRCARGCRSAAIRLVEHARPLRHQPIGRLRQRLEDEVVAVAIDDERRQQVAFAVDEAIGGGVDLQRLAEPDRLIEPVAPAARPPSRRLLSTRPFRRRSALRHQADGDLRAIAVKASPTGRPRGPTTWTTSPPAASDIGQIAPVNPEVAGLRAFDAARGQSDGRCHDA